MMNDSQARALASRFIQLTPEKRSIFLDALAKEGISFSTFPIVPSTNEAGRNELSYTQQRMWFLWQLDPQSAAYNLPIATRLSGPLNVDILNKALNSVVARHEILRTCFPADEFGRPSQFICNTFEVSIEIEDLTYSSIDIQDEQVHVVIKQESLTPFDLINGPLLRVKLIKLSKLRHVLIVTLHHIVADGWSINVLIEELVRYYEAYSANNQPDLDPLPIQYADYALWQRTWLESGELQRQMDYWIRQLEGEQPVLELPTDYPKSLLRSSSGIRYEFEIDNRLAKDLRELARQKNASLFMVLLAAFKILLFRYTSTADIRVGIPIANRNKAETERLIGCFINTQVMRTQLDSQQTFFDLLELVRNTVVDAQAHQDLPFEKLVEALQPERSLIHNPLFQVMFNHQDQLTDVEELSISSGLQLSNFLWEKQTTEFDLKLDTWQKKNSLHAGFTFATDLFERSTIERLAYHWQRILAAMVRDPSQRIAEIPLLDEIETHRILREWNATEVDYGEASCIHSLFEAQVEKTPEAVALIFPAQADQSEQTLTYAQLNTKANQLAHTLKEMGVGPDVLVGIAVERSIEMVIGLLGILKADGVYVPLDPEYPEDRLSYMMMDSGIRLLLTQTKLQNVLSIPTGVKVVYLDQADAWQRGKASNLPLITSPQNLAYVIYTSGSTGRPKGAGNTHRALHNRLAWMQDAYHLTAEDSILQKTPFSFDVSVWEFFWPLLNGAHLVVARPRDHRDPERLVTLIQNAEITTLHFVPSMLQTFIQHEEVGQCYSLRQIVCSGEALTAELQNRVLQILPNIKLHNLYGPTEAAIDVTHWTCINDGQPGVPIGRPIANVQTYIQDDQLSTVPAGVTGELYLGGIELARGYYSKPSLTAERFVPDPYDEQGGGRLYRTGDLARYRSDGNIEYVGRIDHQVKIRGFRIELGEIESQLNAQAEVKEAVVICQQMGEISGQQLVAYVVPAEGSVIEADAQMQSTFRSELKSRLQTVLPEYMVPAQYVLLDKLPLTPNGKLDREALPAVEGSAFTREYEAPQTELECQLVEIWQSVLGVDRVGLNDNFFELGGHSLLATQVVSYIRQTLKVDLSLRTLFEATDLRSLAQRIAIESPIQVISIERVSREQPLLLSYAQQRQWVLWQLEPESAAYHLGAALRLKGILNRKALHKSFEVLIARHEVLRTHFIEQDGELCQVIVPVLSLPVSPQILEITEGETEDQALKRILQSHASEPFNLTTGPLLRARLISLGDDHILSLVQHHIISDAWSMRLMVEELVIAYQAYSQNQLPVLPELPIQYADYAVWQRHLMEAGEGERQLSYWRQQLGDEQPVLELPLDHSRPQQPSYRGATLSQTLSSELGAGVERQARATGVTPFMFLLASFQILLYRYGGQDDIRVGVPIANRTRLETERLIGFFVNTQVLRTQISPEATVSDLLQQVKRTALEAQAHQDLPFEQLVETLQPERSLSYSPLFQVMFNYLQADQSGGSDRLLTQLEDLTVEGLAWEQQTAQFDLTLNVSSSAEGLAASFNYATDLFERSMIERLAYHWQRILAAMVRDPLQRIAEISLLDELETYRILREWNATTVDYREGSCIHSLFEVQVERTPEATALIFPAQADQPEQTLTYAQLNGKANQLAHTLRGVGVGPDVLVGIAVERSIEMVVGLLGILKAGGAYVPLDPEYPEDRLSYMMQDSGIRLLLTQTKLQRTLPVPADVEVLCLDQAETWQQGDTSNLPLITNLQNLAYVIYTSGSAGKPKGVAIQHESLYNHMYWMQEVLQLRMDDRVLQKTAFSFDASVWEFWLPLIAGAQLVLARSTLNQELSRIWEHIAEYQITILQLIPSLLQALLSEADRYRLASLRNILLGGEAINPHVIQQLFRVWNGVLYNLYGPTETTIDATHWTYIDDGHTNVPIGRPIANVQTYIQDSQLSTVPEGVTGELYLGGIGLARGYYGKPSLTAERFVPDLYDEQGGGRLYRTGDLARYRTDGNIEYVGRIDYQVKIRGFRIELGEIESQLNTQAEVKEAVVIAQQVGETGGQQLVAYVIPSDSTLVDEAADAQDIFRASVKAQLQAVLPEYMVPNQYVLLDKLPLTPNGKLDRKALPQVDGSAFAREYEAPQTELEQQLASIWQEVLGVERVGLNDNFFELGGHSLLATQVVSRIRQSTKIKSDIKLRDIFQMKSLKELAELWGEPIDSNSNVVDYPPILNQKRKEPLPLSLAQQRLWLVDQLFNTGTAYNISTALDVKGPLSLSILEKSFTTILRRHEILRTGYTINDKDHPVAIIENNVNLPIVITDVSQQSLLDQELAQKQWLQDCEQEVIDIHRPPLVRMNVIKLSESHHQIFFAMHHIISDGWSMRILVDELTESYRSYICNNGPNLKPLPIQYMDYALWQQQLLEDGHLEQEKIFWQKNLNDVPYSLSLPQKRKMGGGAEFSGNSIVLELPELLSERLKQLAGASNATSHQLLMACFQLLLHRLASVPDLVVGTDLAGRTRQELESLIGFFVNVLPMRSRYSPQQTFSEYLEAICANALDAYEHQMLPLDMILESCGIPRVSGENPLIQILFVTNNVPQSEINIDELRLSPLERGQEHSKFDIAVFVNEFAGKFVCNWTFKTTVYQRETIEAFIANWQLLIDQIVENPLIPLAAIKLEPLLEQSPNIVLGALPSAEDAMNQKLRKLGGFVKKCKNKSQPVAGNNVSESKKALVRISPLRENQQFPLIAEPQARNVDIVAWIQNNRAFVDSKLLSYGCIVFRGFELPTARDFERFAEAVHPGLYDRYGDLPKRKDGDRIYHSTPYPEDKMILFHNESSHQDRWPRKQLFYCEIPSVQGGATPLVDCREMYRLLPVELARRFEEEGLLYVRTFDKNFDVSWQHFFRTDNRQDVEQRCEKSGIEWRWLEGDGLQIRTRGPGVITHPISGEKSFFNQIQLHHHYHLDTDVRTDLLNTLGSDFMPRHVYFGDGSAISDETMQYLADLYEQCAVRFPWQQHDVVLVDNMLVAHARDPYRGPRKIVVAMGDMYGFTDITQKPHSLEVVSGSSSEFDNSVMMAEVEN